MKKLMFTVVACAAVVTCAFAEEAIEGCGAPCGAETAKQARDREGQETMNRRIAEKKAREERARAEAEAYQRAKEECAEKRAAERKGMTVEAYRLERDTKDAERVGVSLETWRGMDRKARFDAMRAANERKALERDTKAAEKAGLSVEDYRLSRDAKKADCTLEEWKALDKDGRRAKKKEADAKRRLEWEMKQAEKAGLSLEDFRAKQEADRRAKREAEEAERKALREKIHNDFNAPR